MTLSWKERFEALPAASRAQRLSLELGTLRDYQTLARYHYRSGRPAAATRVLVMRDERESVAQRFTTSARRTQQRPGDVVAVLVESLPSLSCRMRDHALNDRYGSWLGVRQRARMLNEEVRCISRVIVDPRWRGLGLAVRLVRHALATATTPVTEALAAMGKIHPFFEKAGMTAYPRPPHEHDARLTAALQTAGLSPTALTDVNATAQQIEAMTDSQRTWIIRELMLWHRRSRGGYTSRLAQERREEKPTWHTALEAGQKRLGLEPVYYVKVRDQNVECGM